MQRPGYHSDIRACGRRHLLRLPRSKAACVTALKNICENIFLTQIGCIPGQHLCIVFHLKANAAMKFYTLDTVFSFGRHQGQTVAEVLVENPGYLNFCLQVLDHFCLYRADVEAWQEEFPKLKQQLTAAAWSKLDEKESELQAHQARLQATAYDDDHYDSGDYYSRDDAERDTFDALTDGQYGDYDDFNGDMDSLRDAMGY